MVALCAGAGVPDLRNIGDGNGNWGSDKKVPLGRGKKVVKGLVVPEMICSHPKKSSKLAVQVIGMMVISPGIRIENRRIAGSRRSKLYLRIR